MVEAMTTHRSAALLIASLVGLVSLTGCAGGDGFGASASDSSPAPAKTVPPNGEHYSSVESLKSAFEEAGGDCSNFEQTNKVTHAAESGDCGTGTVLSIYSSVSEKDAVVNGMKQFADVIGMNVLVGENWVVNDKRVAQYQPKMGGTLVTRTATK
ncbi:ABC-type glycerol-3-phosphate transport system substrate-binding protein [Pseudarthrobacter oxydans]|uniref:hypothetical protein n=1 Tax=Pseudarthrobacter oxydans TaxID=1671 RepID=UPI0027889CC5|nr:hypothetical protein [Pseudarthrobacter oxydans]MDP9983583.1 ABC-type glycerol-3-phosphate transport system substrate-binding protein [Pseudarthrobacter oxydans]